MLVIQKNTLPCNSGNYLFTHLAYMENYLGKESNMVVMVQKNMDEIVIIRWEIYWRQN